MGCVTSPTSPRSRNLLNTLITEVRDLMVATAGNGGEWGRHLGTGVVEPSLGCARESSGLGADAIFY